MPVAIMAFIIIIIIAAIYQLLSLLQYVRLCVVVALPQTHCNRLPMKL